MSNMLTPEEQAELRKSLSQIGFTEQEVEEQISKAINKEEIKKEPETIEEMGKKEEGKKDEPEKEEVEETEEEKEIKKSESWKKIEKAIEEHEMKFGKAEIKKSIDTDFNQFDFSEIEKSINSNIEKSISTQFNSIETLVNLKFQGLSDIVKGIQTDVKKIGNTPMPMKSNFNKVNFFEKSIGSDEDNSAEKQLSISKNRDELISEMQDFIEKSTDNDLKGVVSDGLLEYSANREKVTSNAIKGLAVISKQRNITLTT